MRENTQHRSGVAPVAHTRSYYRYSGVCKKAAARIYTRRALLRATRLNYHVYRRPRRSRTASLIKKWPSFGIPLRIGPRLDRGLNQHKSLRLFVSLRLHRIRAFLPYVCKSCTAGKIAKIHEHRYIIQYKSVSPMLETFWTCQCHFQRKLTPRAPKLCREMNSFLLYRRFFN